MNTLANWPDPTSLPISYTSETSSVQTTCEFRILDIQNEESIPSCYLIFKARFEYKDPFSFDFTRCRFRWGTTGLLGRLLWSISVCC